MSSNLMWDYISKVNPNEQKKTFLICDDTSDNYFVGRFTRTNSQIKSELQRLEIGEELEISETRRFIRES